MGLVKILTLVLSLWAYGGYEEEEIPTDPWASPTPSEPVEMPSWDGLMEV